MTEEGLLLIRDLREKIRNVLEKFEHLESENADLHQQVLTLKDRIESLDREKGQLGNQYENLKLARTLESGAGGAAMARQKINKLLREIDKCVALLNG